MGIKNKCTHHEEFYVRSLFFYTAMRLKARMMSALYKNTHTLYTSWHTQT